MAILWSRFFRGTLQFWMSLQLLQLGWGRQSWLGTGDHFLGDSRTPFAVANKGANFHTDTLLNIPKKIFQICKVELPTWQFFVFFRVKPRHKFMSHKRKIQVCITYIYTYTIILVVFGASILGEGSFIRKILATQKTLQDPRFRSKVWHLQVAARSQQRLVQKRTW